MLFFESDIAIDLGTSNVLAYVRGKGIALREPSVVAVDKTTGRLLKAGEEAQKMLGRTPANIIAIHPIAAGVISDYDMTVRMMKEFLSRITSFSLFKPRVICCVPSSVTGVEERAIVDAIIEAGCTHVKSYDAKGVGIPMNRIQAVLKRLEGTGVKLKASGCGKFWSTAVVVGALNAGAEYSSMSNAPQIVDELPIFEALYSSVFA